MTEKTPNCQDDLERIAIARLRRDKAEQEVSRIATRSWEHRDARDYTVERRIGQLGELMGALEGLEHDQPEYQATKAGIDAFLASMDRGDRINAEHDAEREAINDQAILGQATYAYEQEKIIIELEQKLAQVDLEDADSQQY